MYLNNYLFRDVSENKYSILFSLITNPRLYIIDHHYWLVSVLQADWPHPMPAIGRIANFSSLRKTRPKEFQIYDSYFGEFVVNILLIYSKISATFLLHVLFLTLDDENPWFNKI